MLLTDCDIAQKITVMLPNLGNLTISAQINSKYAKR